MQLRNVTVLIFALASFGSVSCASSPPNDSITPGMTGIHLYTAVPESNETAAMVDWNSIPMAYRGRAGYRVRFDCPPNGGDGSVWGTDIYTDDSSACYAGVHYGRIGSVQGGVVVIEMRAGRVSYVGSARNGISSMGYGEFPGSFIVL